MNNGTTIIDQPSNFLDVLSGREAVKIEIGVSVKSIVFLCAGMFLVGILLIAISKNVK